MVIHEVKSLGYKAPVAEFEIHCSKGTYIRSWAEKLGEILGVGGTVQNLRRIQSGKFHLSQAITLDMVPNYADLLNKMNHFFIPLSDILSSWPGLKVRDRDEKLIRNGQVPKGMESYLNHLNIDSGVRVLSEKGSLLALLNREKAAEGAKFTIARVFNTDSSN
jgi:tRNA pseudouridine55 synthase